MPSPLDTADRAWELYRAEHAGCDDSLRTYIRAEVLHRLLTDPCVELAIPYDPRFERYAIAWVAANWRLISN